MACGVLVSGCIHGDSQQAGIVTAKPVDESELGNDVEIYEHDHSDLEGHRALQDALESAYGRTEESGEPQTSGFVIEEREAVFDLKNKARYESKVGNPGEVFYVRYRSRIFEVFAYVT